MMHCAFKYVHCLLVCMKLLKVPPFSGDIHIHTNFARENNLCYATSIRTSLDIYMDTNTLGHVGSIYDMSICRDVVFNVHMTLIYSVLNETKTHSSKIKRIVKNDIKITIKHCFHETERKENCLSTSCLSTNCQSVCRVLFI